MKQFLPPRYFTGISNQTLSRSFHIQYNVAINISINMCEGSSCPLSILMPRSSRPYRTYVVNLDRSSRTC